MNKNKGQLGIADFVIGMVLIPLVIGLFALAVNRTFHFNDKVTEEKEESPACYVDYDSSDTNPGTPYYASDYEGGTGDALAACKATVEIETVEEAPIEDTDNDFGDNTLSIEVDGDVMIWRTTTGVRMCIVKSKVPQDVADGMETYDVFRYWDHNYMCPIKETNSYN